MMIPPSDDEGCYSEDASRVPSDSSSEVEPEPAVGDQEYRDYFDVELSTVLHEFKPPTAKRKGPRGGVVVPFPVRLYDMLMGIEKEGREDVVSWMHHGRSFVVHDPKEFVGDVMPRYFRQSKISSFQRQLNLYGFLRITKGPEKGGYYHALFLKYRPELCKVIIRTRLKGDKIATNVTAPDFNAFQHCTMDRRLASSSNALDADSMLARIDSEITSVGAKSRRSSTATIPESQSRPLPQPVPSQPTSMDADSLLSQIDAEIAEEPGRVVPRRARRSSSKYRVATDGLRRFVTNDMESAAPKIYSEQPRNEHSILGAFSRHQHANNNAPHPFHAGVQTFRPRSLPQIGMSSSTFQPLDIDMRPIEVGVQRGTNQEMEFDPEALTALQGLREWLGADRAAEHYTQQCSVPPAGPQQQTGCPEARNNSADPFQVLDDQFFVEFESTQFT